MGAGMEIKDQLERLEAAAEQFNRIVEDTIVEHGIAIDLSTTYLKSRRGRGTVGKIVDGKFTDIPQIEYQVTKEVARFEAK